MLAVVSRAILLLAGLGLSGAAMAQPVRTGPAGVDFYLAPSPLPAGALGSVIWARPLAAEASLTSAARNTLVLYRSTVTVSCCPP